MTDNEKKEKKQESGLVSTHKYNNYDDYVNFQLQKTRNKQKQARWLGPEWDLKIKIFKTLFEENIYLIKDKKNALCLGSRTGQEVVALKELGVENAIGIDLHEFKPYTIKGDIHKLNFKNDTFDLEFTNILDHSLYPDQFAKEIYRTLKKGGIFILHIQYEVHSQDKYTETIISSLENIEQLFKNFTLIKKRKIQSGIIAMNYEFIFKK